MSVSWTDAGRAALSGPLPRAAALFVLLSVIFAFSVDIRATRGASITADEPFYLLTTRSLLSDRDLDLRNQYGQGAYVEFFDHPDGLWRQSVPAGDGRLLSPHNPGLSVLIMPGYALGGLAGVQVQLMLIAAATFALAYVLAGRLTGRGGLSWLAALSVGVGAVAFIHSTEIYPEFPAALVLVLCLLLLAARPRPGAWEAAGVAALLSAMCWLGIKYAPLALLVAAWLLMRADGRGRAVLLVLGVGSAAAYAWFHVETFGGLTPYSVNLVHAGQSTAQLLGSHIGVGDPGVLTDRAYRVWGLFVDERFGIGRWAPVLLLAVPGLVLLERGGQVQRLVLALIIVQILIASFVAITIMGWWFPGRTLVTVLPLMIIPVTLAAGAASPRARAVMAVLALYGAAVTAGLAHAGHSGQITIAVDPFDMSYPPFAAMAWLFPDYRAWTAGTWTLTCLWLALAAASAVLAARAGGAAAQMPGLSVPQKEAVMRLVSPALIGLRVRRRMRGLADMASSPERRGGAA